MKKLFLLLLLLPLALFSCSGGRYYGTYSFQMGSDKGTHFGFVTELIDKDVYLKDEETGQEVYKGKSFTLGMKLSPDIVPELPEYDPDDPAGYIEQLFMYIFIDILNVEDNPDGGLKGYFNIGDQYTEEKGKRLLMTIVEDEIEIPEELLRQIIVGYIKNQKVQMVLPVSSDDLQCQLCWYGTFVYFYYDKNQDLQVFSTELDENKLPGPKGLDLRIGTHPTISEVIEMNETFSDVFQQQLEDGGKINFKFRDYNSLSIDLLKN